MSFLERFLIQNKKLLKYFKSDKKISPGRWGNVGDFASKNTKERAEIWSSWTTMDHCGDDKCGTPSTYSKVKEEVYNKNIKKGK